MQTCSGYVSSYHQMIKSFASHSSLHFKVIASCGILRFITPWWDCHSNQTMFDAWLSFSRSTNTVSHHSANWVGKRFTVWFPPPSAEPSSTRFPSLGPSSHYYSCQPINQRLRSVLRGSHTGKEPYKLWVSIRHLNISYQYLQMSHLCIQISYQLH